MRYLSLLLLLSACGAPAPCSTADLDLQYGAKLELWCQGRPLEQCPAASALGDEYERATRERLEQCPASK